MPSVCMAAMCLEMTGLSVSWSDKGVGELKEKIVFCKLQQWLSSKGKIPIRPTAERKEESKAELGS